MRRCRLALAAALAAPLALTGPVSAGTPGEVEIVGVFEVGSTVLPAVGVPSGASCQWLRSGVAISGATSCTGYVVQSADVSAGANALTLEVTTAGVTLYPAIALSGTPAPTGTVGASYSFAPAITGGPGSQICTLTGGSVPGLSMTNCVLGGVPTTPGAYSGLSISVIDSIGGSAVLPANPFTVTISAGSPAAFFFPSGSNLITAAATFN